MAQTVGGGRRASVRLWGLLTLAATWGCTVGPDYNAPAIEMPEQFSSPTRRGAADPAQVARWWKSFDDELLESLVQRAVEGNKEVRIAVARVDQARALARASYANFWPQFDVQSSYTRTRYSSEQFPIPGAKGFTVDLWNSAADATWELDLFGRVRRSYEAQQAIEQASEAGLLDALRMTAAETATAYFQLRGAQNQLATTRQNIEAEEETLRIVEIREKNGAASELDTVQSRAQLSATRALMPAFEAAERTAIHRLGVLLGLPPESLIAELSKPRAIPLYRGNETFGDPAELLRRRPDLRAAERQLAAATARIGMATADLFPRLTFQGSFGLSASTPSNWSNGGAQTYNFGPNLSWVFLDFGRVQARIDAADAETQAVLAGYESAVLRALEEVENGLTAFGRARARRAELLIAVAASARAVELSRLRFNEGAVDLLRVIEAQRAKLANDAALTAAETDIGIALVSIYKAIGGGWEGYQLVTQGKRTEVQPTARDTSASNRPPAAPVPR